MPEPALILVVDDSPGVRNLVSEILIGEGYRVRTAVDGVAAIDEIEAAPPDLIVTDIHMPRLSGFGLCRVVKAPERARRPPVLVLSATGRDTLITDAVRKAGADSFLPLPFDAGEFIEMVRRLLTQPTVPALDPEAILVVDDQPEVARMIGVVLEKRAYRVYEAHDGAKALEIVAQHRPRLVILDFMMPGMDGLEVLKRIKVSWPDTLVVMLTARASDSLAVECMKAGAVDYLTKPFNVTDIPKLVADVILRDHALRVGLMMEAREKLFGALDERIQRSMDGLTPQTARQMARENLWLAYAVRTLATAVFVTDAEGRLLFVNDAICQQAGVDRSRLLGRSFSVLLGDERPAELAKNLLAAGLAAGWNGEVQIATREGRRFPAHLVLSKIPREDRSDAGEPAEAEAMLGMFRDISPIRRLQEELDRKHEQLEAANRVRTIFLSHMSHELRTPLNAIIGFANVLRDGNYGGLNPKQAQLLDNILGGGQKLLKLLEGVMLLTKLDLGQEVLHPTSVDLVRVLEDLAMLTRPILYRVNGSFDLALEEGLPYLHVDPTLLRLAMLHLLERVLDGVREGDKIQVAARRDENRVEVEFRIEGRPLPKPLTAADGYDELKLPRDMARRLGGDLYGHEGLWTLALPVELVAPASGDRE